MPKITIDDIFVEQFCAAYWKRFWADTMTDYQRNRSRQKVREALETAAAGREDVRRLEIAINSMISAYPGDAVLEARQPPVSLEPGTGASEHGGFVATIRSVASSVRKWIFADARRARIPTAVEQTIDELHSEIRSLGYAIADLTERTEMDSAAVPVGSFTIEDFAQEIRRVDGDHSLGADALAEALMPFLSSRRAAGIYGAGYGAE